MTDLHKRLEAAGRREAAGFAFAICAIYLAGLLGLLIGFMFGRYTNIKPWDEL